MSKRGCAVGVMLAGVVLVGVLYGCVWHAFPDCPASSGWSLLLLWGPYLLSAAGCRLSSAPILRAVAGLVILTGLVMAGIVIWECWPVFHGARSPVISAALLLNSLLLIGQYGFGLAGIVGGLTKRFASDATRPIIE